VRSHDSNPWFKKPAGSWVLSYKGNGSVRVWLDRGDREASKGKENAEGPRKVILKGRRGHPLEVRSWLFGNNLPVRRPRPAALLSAPTLCGMGEIQVTHQKPTDSNRHIHTWQPRQACSGDYHARAAERR
jgi:hypothetical protein